MASCSLAMILVADFCCSLSFFLLSLFLLLILSADAMLKGLTKMTWERVDVNFSGSKQRFFAHNTIQACTNLS